VSCSSVILYSLSLFKPWDVSTRPTGGTALITRQINTYRQAGGDTRDFLSSYSLYFGLKASDGPIF
jgi:hypothetical protein